VFGLIEVEQVMCEAARGEVTSSDAAATRPGCAIAARKAGATIPAKNGANSPSTNGDLGWTMLIQEPRNFVSRLLYYLPRR
jgi:hypothetical protein